MEPRAYPQWTLRSERPSPGSAGRGGGRVVHSSADQSEAPGKRLEVEVSTLTLGFPRIRALRPPPQPPRARVQEPGTPGIRATPRPTLGKAPPHSPSEESYSSSSHLLGPDTMPAAFIMLSECHLTKTLSRLYYFPIL